MLSGSIWKGRYFYSVRFMIMGIFFVNKFSFVSASVGPENTDTWFGCFKKAFEAINSHLIHKIVKYVY